MANDLDWLTPSSGACGEYGVLDPLNAWFGASDHVCLYQHYMGAQRKIVWQAGYDHHAASPTLNLRFKVGDYWSAWQQVLRPDQVVITGIAPASGPATATQTVTLTGNHPTSPWSPASLLIDGAVVPATFDGPSGDASGWTLDVTFSTEGIKKNTVIELALRMWTGLDSNAVEFMVT